MTNNTLPGEKNFFVVTNADIYRKVNEIDRYVTQLKNTFWVLSVVIMPAVSTVVSLIINNAMKEG